MTIIIQNLIFIQSSFFNETIHFSSDIYDVARVHPHNSLFKKLLVKITSKFTLLYSKNSINLSYTLIAFKFGLLLPLVDSNISTVFISNWTCLNYPFGIFFILENVRQFQHTPFAKSRIYIPSQVHMRFKLYERIPNFYTYSN